MAFHEYPYTDFHEMNLDWILQTVKQLTEDWAQVRSDWEDEQAAFADLQSYIENYFNNLDVQQEINVKLDGLVLDGTMSELIAPYVASGLPAEVASQLGDVVATQIGAVVAAQIGAVVADQLPAIAASAASTEVGTWLSTHIDPDTGYVIDDSLTVQGAAADSKATGDQVSELKSALTELFKTPSENIFDGKFTPYEQVATSTGAFVAGNDYARTDHIPISAGVVNVGVKIPMPSDARFGAHYCVYNSSKVKVEAGNISSLTTTDVDDLRYFQLSVANDGFIAFDIYRGDRLVNLYYVSQVASPSGYFAFVPHEFKPELIEVNTSLNKSGIPADAKATGDAIGVIENDVDAIETFDNSLTAKYIEYTTDVITPTWTSGYVTTNGVDHESEYYIYTGKISVSEGDIVRPYYVQDMRFVCAYNNDVAVVAKGSDVNIPTYTVPSGIDSVVVSTYTSETKIIVDRRISNQTKVKAQEEVNTLRGGYLSNVADDLATGEGLYLSRNSLVRNKKIVFRASVSGDSWSVCVAHGVVDNSYDANTYSQGFIITPTTATPWTDGKDGSGGNTGTAWTHGLTITDRLEVIISVGNDSKYTLMLISEHGMVSKSYDSVFQGRKGSIYAKVLTGSMSDCILTFGCSDLEKPIWLFGDSYVSIVSNRYPYWMVESGIDNCLINSYPGEASPNALKDAKMLLEMATPRFIIWGLGMNDHDTSSAPNTDWQNCLNGLIQICTDRKITLILCTIPNVPNVAYNNVKKNEWIEAHDYRYVDFNKAIGAADEVGASWPEGWISADNVHPSDMGARVLAMQIMADVPELIQP